VKKIRIDVLLVERGLCESRARAAALVIAGAVRTGPDSVARKPSDTVAPDAELTVDAPCPYVSRGAYKLLEALEKHLPDLSGMTVLDAGASTGGFTDLALQKGAAKVYAVDAGYGQLHARLRADPRVISMEKVNARHMTEASLPEKADVLTMDVSFISAVKVLSGVGALLKPGGRAFILVKPQFEAERHEVGGGGVVRDPEVIARCVEKVASFAESALGWRRLDCLKSPITGPKGNTEFMLVLEKPAAPASV
jgi:23S rRNA (cytidine1920-2'-O)/16S rRNA (cytidine1409-2'-O)-methyltransferase